MNGKTVRADEPTQTRNELLEKLDAALKTRADNVVAAALNPVEINVVSQVADALVANTGNHFRSEIIRIVSNAFDRLGEEAARIIYRGLLERVTTQLTDGKPVDLT